MKKIIILLLGVFLLAGCSSGSKEKEVTCTIAEQGVESTVVYTGEGDEVFTSKTTFKLKYDLFGVVDQSMKEQLKEQYEATYTQMEGITIEVSIDGEEYLEMSIDVDYRVADKDYLVAAGLLDSDDAENDTVSLEKMLELNEEAGYTCK